MTGQAMEYFPNFPAGSGARPDAWAKEKEAEGWHGICASDHFWVGGTRYPHVFVAATQMACATERVQITTSFCNNLFRSPVEFAQAALSLQQGSNGRFEAGLGAGWSADELHAAGMEYPEPRHRVGRYVDAFKVVRELIHTGQCVFQGDYYQVDVSGDRKLADVTEQPPLLVGAAGGPRSLREVTPIVDRIEIKANARATRVGHLDFPIMATVTEDEVRTNVERVRAVRGDIPMGIFLLVGVGDDARTQMVKSQLGDGFLGQFFGAPEQVSQALQGLEGLGISRVQITELSPGTASTLAEFLL